MIRTERGLTMLELLIILTIVSIVCSVSLGPLRALHQQSVIRTALYQALRSVNHTRQLAVENARTYSLCVFTAALNCQNHWQGNVELIIFEDLDNDEQLGEDEPVFYREEWLDPSLKGKLAAANKQTLAFYPSGASLNGNISLCPAHASTASSRKIVIARGRPRINASNESEAINCS